MKISYKNLKRQKKNPKKTKNPKKIQHHTWTILKKPSKKKKAAGDSHLSTDCLFRRFASTIKLLFSLSIKKKSPKNSQKILKKSKNEDEKDKKYR